VLYVIACKTTQRVSRSLDKRDVENNFERTDLTKLFPGRKSEQDNNNRSDVWDYIGKTIEAIVRIHFVFPEPTSNWLHDSKEKIDLVIPQRIGQKRTYNEKIPQYIFNVSLKNLNDYFPQKITEYLNNSNLC